MVSIFGWHTSAFKSERPANVRCFNCQSTGEMEVSYLVSSFHFFFIPLFPYRIQRILHCHHCQVSISKQELGPELSPQYGPLLKWKFPPFWHFGGPLILLGILAFGWFKQQKASSVLLQRLANIEKGRSVTMMDEEDNQTTFKVLKIDNDTIYAVGPAADTVVWEKSLLEGRIKSGQLVDIFWRSYDDMEK